MERHSCSIISAVIILLFILGCIYSFSSFKKINFNTISIPVFENKTIRYGIETVLSNAVIDEFIKEGRSKVVDKGDITLVGEVNKYERVPFSYDEVGNVKEYKVDVEVKIILKSKEGKILFEKKLNRWLPYESTKEEEEAIKDVCKLLAEDILKLTYEGW